MPLFFSPDLYCCSVSCWVEWLEQSSAYSAKANIVAWHGVRSGSMAQLCFNPPEAFKFHSPDEWPRWKKCFQQFRLASGLSEDSNAKQVSTLLYCMEQDTEETLASTNISAADRKQYDRVQRLLRLSWTSEVQQKACSAVNQWNSLSRHSITEFSIFS